NSAVYAPNTRDLMMGNAPDFTLPSNNRSLAGSLAHVAYFTNALSGATISNLFYSAAVPPYIAYQPLNLGTFVSYSNALTMQAGGSGALTYQWYKGTPGSATTVSDGGGISGSAANNLVFNPAASAHAGTYFVVVTNSFGSVTSSVATLTVST